MKVVVDLEDDTSNKEKSRLFVCFFVSMWVELPDVQAGYLVLVLYCVMDYDVTADVGSSFCSNEIV